MLPGYQTGLIFDGIILTQSQAVEDGGSIVTAIPQVLSGSGRRIQSKMQRISFSSVYNDRQERIGEHNRSRMAATGPAWG